MTRRIAATALAVALALGPAPRPVSADVAGLDAIAIVTDTALARIAQSLLPVRFTVDGQTLLLDGVQLCPASDEHDLDLVGLASPDGVTPVQLPLNACDSTLPALASGAESASLAPWRAAVRVHVSWNGDYMLKGTIADTAIAVPQTSAPAPSTAPNGIPAPAGASSAVPSAPAPPSSPATASAVPDALRLRAELTASPLFLVDTRHLIDLDFSGKRFAMEAVPKFEAHRIVVELMRDSHEAGDHAAWNAFEVDTAAGVPAGSDAVIAGTHPFIGRTLAEAFATPVEVYRAQDHVITIHDVREAGVAGDVRASGEAVDTVSGVSGLITGEYSGTPDLTLQRIDVVPHEKSCSFVDLACVTNNLGLRIGSGALARQLMSRYGNSPLRPAQPIAFPIALEGRSLNLTIDAIQSRSSAAALRIAGRLDVTAR